MPLDISARCCARLAYLNNVAKHGKSLGYTSDEIDRLAKAMAEKARHERPGGCII